MTYIHKSKLSGIIPIVAAPFTAQGAVDEDSLQALVRQLIRTGASALTLFGLATEFYKLSDAEKMRMQTILLAETSRSETVAGVISITAHSWELATQHARTAQAQGADALMLLPPFFLSPSERAIMEHIRRVVSAVTIPVIIQYAPAQTGVRVSPDVFLRLRDELPNADYVKVEVQPPGPYISQLVERSGGRLGALVGYAGLQMPDALARGAVGIQPGCSFTEIYVEIFRRYRVGDGAAMLALYQQLLPYISAWMQGVEVIVRAEKTILQRRGLIASDYCRQPAYTLDARELALIAQFLDEFVPFLRPQPVND
jgi:4-hydroxy-tetrahydrodipicolinate synthase